VLCRRNVKLEDLSTLLHLGSSFTNVPDGTAHWTFDGDTNYKRASGDLAITITPAPLSVTAASPSRLYGASNPTFTGKIVGIKNGDNITATYASVATPASPVGTYPIVPTLVDPSSKLGNYTVTINNGTLTVNPAPLTITADNKTKILNAPNPALTPTYSGFVLGQGPGNLTGALTCATTAITTTSVGSYPITCLGQMPSLGVSTFRVEGSAKRLASFLGDATLPAI